MEKLFYVGFGVLTAVSTKGSVFKDVTLHITVKVNQYFGGTYHVHFQVMRKPSKNQHEAGDMFLQNVH
jgi:hypothetical protein